MARSHSTPSRNPVNDDPHREIARKSCRNGRNIMLNEEWALVLDIHDHAFLAELDNMTNLSCAVWKQIGGEWYFLCTSAYMEGAVLGWNTQAQKARWKSLSDMGLIHIEVVGFDRKRYVHIDYERLNLMVHAARNGETATITAVRARERNASPKVQISTFASVEKSTDAKGTQPTDASGSGSTFPSVGTLPEKTHHGRRMRKDTLSHDASATASPPLVTTVSESTTPTKERRGGSSPQQQATPAAVNKDIQCRSETEPTDDAYEKAFPLPPKTGKVTLSIPGMSRKTFDSMEEAKEYAARFKDTARSPEPPPLETVPTPTKTKTGLLGDDAEPRTLGREWAVRLHDMLRRKDKIRRRKVNIGKWARTLDQFHRDGGCSVAEMEYVLSHYERFIGVRYCPQPYAAETLCEKFVGLLDYIKDKATKRQETEDVIG